MKKTYLIIFILIILTIIHFSCTVNESTSCLTIQNKSNTTVTNIKIGDTIISSYLAPGAQTAYYFSYNDIEGELTANGAISGKYIWELPGNKKYVKESNGTYKLIAGNYHFYSEIFESRNKYWITLWCEKQGEDYNDEPEDQYEDFYEE